MPIDTSNARHKLNQAMSQLERARLVFAAWATPENVGTIFIRDRDLAMDHYAVYVKTLPGPEFSLEVGDFLANAREALDYLAWLIFRAAGGDANAKEAKHVYFPIESEDTSWGKAKKSIPNRWPEAEQTLWKLQDAQMPAADNMLYMLHTLANSKKHRDLHLVSISSDRTFSLVMPELPSSHSLAIAFAPGALELEPGVATPLSSYLIHDVDDPDLRPVNRTRELTIEQPPAPEWEFGLTDGNVTVNLQHLHVMASRVEQAISAVAGLNVPNPSADLSSSSKG
ncbi:hypothetical protein [Pseudarthrobacter siccitolerans]